MALKGGGYHEGMAQVLPRETGPTGDIFMMLQQQSELRRREAMRQQQLDQQRADMMTKYVGDEFKDKDFATGTAADPAINGLLGTMRQKYVSMIQKNPNVPMAELMGAMQKDISEMNSWASAVKTKRDDIRKAVEAMKSYKNIDPAAVEKLAMHNFLYKVDPATGQKTLKPPTELDLNTDYVSSVMDSTPELVLRSGFLPDEAEMIKKQPTSRADNIVVTDDNGIKREKGYKAELYPFQEITEVGGAPQVKVKSVKAKIGDKEVDVASDELYSMYNDLESQVWLNAQVKAKGIDPKSKEGDIAKRRIVYERNKDVRAKEFTPVDKTNEDVWLAKYNAGLMAGTMSQSLKAIRDLIAGKGFNDTDLQLQTISGQNQELISAAPTVTIDGVDYKDVSALGKNGLILTKKGGKTVYNQVLIDPQNPGTAYVYDVGTAKGERIESSKRVLTGKALRDYIVKNAPYNESNAQKALFQSNPYFDETGNMKVVAPPPQPAAAAQTGGAAKGFRLWRPASGKKTEPKKTDGNKPKIKVTW